MENTATMIQWMENQQLQSMRWHSENANPAPKRVQIADDTITAEAAYRLACEGCAILWRGDFQNARQLLQAIARRIDKKKTPKKSRKNSVLPEIKTKTEQAQLPAESLHPTAIEYPANTAQFFHLHRQAQSQRARVLAMLLIQINPDFSIPLRRAPDVRLACTQAYKTSSEPFIVSLRELQGLIGAHEWRKKGVSIDALGATVYPHYGVYSPLRGEYLDLIAKARLPSTELAFDIGTGSGVIAALLAKRGVQKIIATDLDPRALVCARENLQQLGVEQQVSLLETDLFPEGKAPLIVCNPPWVPARPNSGIEHAVYDPDSKMLRGFLNGVAAHLEDHGEAWLILSDIAQHLGLRSQQQLWDWIDLGGLQVIGKMDIRPKHAKATDDTDPLHFARSAEVTSLWRLSKKA